MGLDKTPVEISVYDNLEGITTINSSNSRRYKEIKKLIDDLGDRPIILDFRYIELVKPEVNQDFKDIVTDSRVKIKLHNNDDLYKTITFILLLSGIEVEGKLENVIHKIDAPRDKWDIEKERIFKFVDKTYVLENGIGKIKLCDEISVINRNTYVQGIRDVIEAHKNETNKFELYTYGMEIVKTQLDSISTLIVELAVDGIELEVLTSDEETKRIVQTYLNLGKNRNLNVKERIKLLDDMLELKTAGMLTTYVKGGKRDIFGRSGNAEVATTLPAIYIGHDNEFAYFKVFRESTFMRKLEYALRNDSQEHPGLAVVEKKIRIKELGICASCVGYRHHFNMPIQFDKQGMQKVYLDTAGEQLKVIEVSFPQYMKMVFDDWDIDYNVMELCSAIKVTKDKLRTIGIDLR